MRQAAVLSAVSMLPSGLASGQTPGNKNSRLNFALIGCGGNGTRTAPVGQAFADLVALCDVDARHLGDANKMLADGKANAYADYRDVLSRKDIDLVQISAPDHWHTKILVEAMLAGKDAYCEKPLTLTINEGKLIRRVQQKTGQVVQVGTQQRSYFNHFVKALAIIGDGRIGKLKRVHVGLGKGSWSPEIPVVAVPKTLDWDRWLGPAPKTEYRYLAKPNGNKGFSNNHTQFRWWYEYSGGKLTDWGAHHVDIAMLGIQAAGQTNDPVSVEGTAKHEMDFVDGHPTQADRYNTAQEFNLIVKFADDDVQMSIRHDLPNGIRFEGDEGELFVTRGKLQGKPVDELKQKPLPSDAIAKAYRGMPMKQDQRPAHWENFVHAIEHRVLPISDVHSHMKMLNVCHLGGICSRLGRQINWDQVTEQIVGDDLARSMMGRASRAGYEIEGV